MSAFAVVGDGSGSGAKPSATRRALAASRVIWPWSIIESVISWICAMCDALGGVLSTAAALAGVSCGAAASGVAPGGAAAGAAGAVGAVSVIVVFLSKTMGSRFREQRARGEAPAG